MTPIAARRAPSVGPARILSFVLMLPVLIVPFVDFAHATSPWELVSGFMTETARDGASYEAFALAAGFFVGWLIVAARLRFATVGALGTFGSGAAWAIALVAGAIDALLAIAILQYPSWLRILGLVPVVAWLVGTLLIRPRWSNLLADDRDALAAMEIAFISHALLPLLAFVDLDEPGWWLTAASVTGLAIDFALNLRADALPAEPHPGTP